MSQQDPEAQCREAALRLLTRREHSRVELIQKLSQRGFEAELIETILARLIELQLQSDERFAFAYVRSRALRGYGPVRIQMELKQKGVSDHLCCQAINQAELDWFELALEQRQKRFGDAVTSERKEQAKRWRFLQYRGFDSEQTRYALKSLTETL